jgi:predicted metal-binding membrane protein
MACVAIRGEEGERAFLAVAAVLFVASAAVTIGVSLSDVPICGGGTMSAAWRPMPGQTWPAAAASFLGMWLAMMMAMMLPSLVPMLRRYRQAVTGAGAPLDRLTALVGAGYFCVWTGAGLMVFALGAVLPPVGSPAVGAVLLLAGLLQFTAGKRQALACCRERPGWLAADADTAWRYGLHLGLQCARSSAGLTAVLLVAGMMDLGIMVAVTATITVERLGPRGAQIARAIGFGLVGAGLLLLARVVGLG